MAFVRSTNAPRPDGGSPDVGTDPALEAPGHRRRPRRPLVVFLVVTCLALITVDVGLALRVRQLNARIGGLTRLVEARERPLLVEGEPFPAITLLGADGRSVPLLVAAESTLLFVSSPSCDVCDDVRPHWNAVAELCAGSHVRVLELVLDVEPATLPERGDRYPVLAPGDDVWSLVGRIPGVPAAILVDEEGTVLRSFYGNDHDGLQGAIELYLSS